MDNTLEAIKTEVAFSKYKSKSRNIQPTLLRSFRNKVEGSESAIPVICFNDEDFDTFEDFYRTISNFRTIPNKFFVRKAEASPDKDIVTAIFRIKGQFYISNEFTVKTGCRDLFLKADVIRHKDMEFAYIEEYFSSLEFLFLITNRVKFEFYAKYFPNSLVFDRIVRYPSFRDYCGYRRSDLYDTSQLNNYYVYVEKDFAFFTKMVEDGDYFYESFLSIQHFYEEGILKLSEAQIKDLLNFYVSKIWNERLVITSEGYAYSSTKKHVLATNQEWIDILKLICGFIELTYSVKGIGRSKSILEGWDCNLKSLNFCFLSSEEDWNEGFE